MPFKLTSYLKNEWRLNRLPILRVLILPVCFLLGFLTVGVVWGMLVISLFYVLMAFYPWNAHIGRFLMGTDAHESYRAILAKSEHPTANKVTKTVFSAIWAVAFLVAFIFLHGTGVNTSIFNTPTP